MTFVAANTPFKEPSSVATESSIEEGSKVVSLSVSDTETLGDVNSVQSIQKYLHSEDSAVKEASKESDKAAPSEASPREVKGVVEESQSIQKNHRILPKNHRMFPKNLRILPSHPIPAKNPTPSPSKPPRSPSQPRSLLQSPSQPRRQPPPSRHVSSAWSLVSSSNTISRSWRHARPLVISDESCASAVRAAAPDGQSSCTAAVEWRRSSRCTKKRRPTTESAWSCRFMSSRDCSHGSRR